MLVRCNECDREFVVDLAEVEVKPGLAEVGFECPMCHTWHHSYYTTPALKRQRVRTAKYRAKAGRSAANWDRYQRKKGKYAAAFDRVNRQKTPSG